MSRRLQIEARLYVAYLNNKFLRTDLTGNIKLVVMMEVLIRTLPESPDQTCPLMEVPMLLFVDKIQTIFILIKCKPSHPLKTNPVSQSRFSRNYGSKSLNFIEQFSFVTEGVRVN